MIHLSVLSRKYLRVSVKQVRRPAEAPPLTDSIIEFAFTETPESADWHPGAWEVVGSRNYARILVGPGGVALARGMRPVMLRLTDNPERPVWRAGYVMIF